MTLKHITSAIVFLTLTGLFGPALPTLSVGDSNRTKWALAKASVALAACPKKSPDCLDRQRIDAQVKRHRLACDQGLKSKDATSHEKLTAQCDAYLPYLRYKANAKAYKAHKAKLKKLYVRGCDVHHLAMHCGTYVARGSNRLSKEAILKDARYIKYKKLAAKACADGDAEHCGALLFMFGKKVPLSKEDRALHMKHLKQHALPHCKRRKDDNACMMLFATSTYEKKWAGLKNLCQNNQLGAACKFYGDHMQGQGKWYATGCALGNMKSCRAQARYLRRREPKKARALYRRACAKDLGACVDLERMIKL